MDDKLMDDFDTDFITGILSSSGELQMADNLMQDLMGELDAHSQMQDVAAEWNGQQPQVMHYSNQMTAAPGNYLHHHQQPLSMVQQYENNSNNQMQMMTINTNLVTAGPGQMLASPTLNQTNYAGGYEVMHAHQQQPQHSSGGHPFLISPNNSSDSNSGMAPVMIMSPPQQQFMGGGGYGQQQQQLQQAPMMYHHHHHQAAPAVEASKRGRKNLKDILKDDNNFIKTIPTPATIAAIASREQASRQQKFVNQAELLQPPPPSSSDLSQLVKIKNRSISSLIGGGGTGTVSPVLSPNNFSLPPTPQSPNHHFVVESNCRAEAKMVSPGADTATPSDLASQVPVSPIDFKPLVHADQSVSSTSTSTGQKGRPSKNSSEKAGGKAKKPKVQKRTAHNAIEKKYRSSINDKICELKNKVAGPGAKLQKSGILRSALDFIYGIEGANKRLHDENQALRNALNSISLNYTNPSAIQTILSSINLNSPSTANNNKSQMPITPPNSDPETSQTADSPPLLRPSTPPQAEQKQQTTAKRPAKMMRTVLCMCVLSVLVFNPFSLVMPADDAFTFAKGQAMPPGVVYQSNSRVLNSVVDSPEDETVRAATGAGYRLGFLVTWLLNAGLIAVLMVWLFVTGEDFAAGKVSEKSSAAVLASYQRASKSFSQRKYFESFESCEKGLGELGRSVPKSRLELLVGIVWQLARLVLHRLYIGRLLSRYAVWIHGDKLSPNSFKLSALFYYELHKFSYLNLKSFDELKQLAASKSQASLLAKTFSSENGKLIETSLYSRLTALYYMLACYNTCEMYLEQQSQSQSSSEVTARDKYNLSEFYFSFALYLTFFLPSALSKPLVSYLVNKKLLVKFTDESNTCDGRCKLSKLKSFLNNKIFVQFMNDQGYLTSFNQAYVSQAKLFGADSDYKAYIELKDLDRQKLLSLVSFKRKLLASSFLYDSDDRMDSFADHSVTSSQKSSAVTGGSVACDFLMTRFQDYVLFRLTDHIISHSGMTSGSSSQMTSSSIETIDYISKNETAFEDQDEEDQQEFESIKQIYERNLDYFSSSSGQQAVSMFTAHSSVQQDTQFILLEFLNMLNNWKLRKFNYKCHKTSELRNLKKSEFLDAVICVLKAYECVFDSSDKRTVDYCKKAIDLLNSFNENKSASGFGTNNHLVEKFELLIYDWILSSQTYLWTKKRSADLDLFNQTLKKFKKIAVNCPQINYKIQMYETVMMYTSNRNPINLVQPAKQFLFSKSNQDALYSMNFLLKKFHLQIIE